MSEDTQMRNRWAEMDSETIKALESERDALKADCAHREMEEHRLQDIIDKFKAELEASKKAWAPGDYIRELESRAQESEAKLRRAEMKSTRYREALEKINGGFCEGNADEHSKCEEWMRDIAQEALKED